MNAPAKIVAAPSPDYWEDGYGWAIAQADLLKRRRFELVDWDNVIEEIESMGKSERSQYTSHMIRVLLHMIKWEAQPERRGMSWWLSIINGRLDADRVLSENPSLKPLLDDMHGDALKYARRKAVAETGLDRRAIEAIAVTRTDALDRVVPRPDGE